MGKDFYEIGEIPELGVVPKYMLASCLRRERYGKPINALKTEKVPVPTSLKPDEVLVYVMAAGVNYNVIWASNSYPIDVLKAANARGETFDYFIPGSDASGVVWKVGTDVENVKVGDHVILHGGRWNVDAADVKKGEDPTFSASYHMWGYETNHGALAQYTKVMSHQCLLKPKDLPWSKAGCFMVGAAAAYRMLHGWEPHTLNADDPVLVWGGSGGLGGFGIQLCKLAGARAVAVVSSEDKKDYCKKLGAVGVINRKDFDHWGRMPETDDTKNYRKWLIGVKKFRRAFWEAIGEKVDPIVVFEHPGEDTIPTSVTMAARGGMIVFCAATSGFYSNFDLRYQWVHQKRLQGTHFANTEQCQEVVNLVGDGEIDPCLTKVFGFEETAQAHQLMADGNNYFGNMGILVNAATAEQVSL
ncbi:MAG: crotonyl-CoA carboxylase/reductase [Thermodesulfobacteriota bacterium]